MLRLLDLRNLNTFGDGAGVQYGEPVAQLQDGDKIVGDVEQSRSVPAVQLPQQLQDLSLSDRVQGARRFVGYEDRGAMQKGQCNQNPLRLANADLPRLSAQEAIVAGGQLHLIHQLLQTRLQRFPSC